MTAPCLAALAATPVFGGILMSATVRANPDIVQVELRGVKDPECTMSGLVGPLDLGRLDRTGQRHFSFAVACNAPYTYAVASKNGALTLVGHEPPARIPYTINSAIGGATTSGDCNAAGAATGCAIAAAPESAAPHTAEVTISWALDAATPAGVYQDELIFTVQPQP